VVVDELPATDVAVVVHQGPYEGLADAYWSLGAWVGAHAEAADLAVRERYLVTEPEAGTPEDLRTEISWPILARPDPTTPGSRPGPRPRCPTEMKEGR
jgi:effector-binding domain-containing protein